MRQCILAISIFLAALPALASNVSMPVPGAVDASGHKVLTFIAKDPPGVRCNGNLQVAAEIANSYRITIQLIPSSLVPNLPAPSVFYGTQMIAADRADFNGAVSFQMIADLLELEGVPKQTKAGLLFEPKVHGNLNDLKDSIKSGGKQ